MADYIEREKAIYIIAHEHDEGAAIAELQALPAADVLPVVRGRWSQGELAQKCSSCGYAHYTDLIFNFCPNCGADMREEEKKPDFGERADAYFAACMEALKPPKVEHE